jgi:hypothetical protein
VNNSVPVSLVEQNVRQLTYSVLADMVNDGSYSVDISNDISSIDFIDSKLELINNGAVLGKPCSNDASITLYNEDGKYSADNVNNIESMYPGKFRRNTKIKIIAGFIDSNNIKQTRELFNGVIVGFKYKTSNKEHTVNLKLKDFAKFLQKKSNPDHSYVNGKYYEGALFNSTISCCNKVLVL